MQRLKSVPVNTPEPPYPRLTKANGWKPEQDIERILQSRTWVLCPPRHRPWLLLLWMESWRSVPAGSLPDDDEMIAARIGMDHDQFEGARKHLMKGWTRHADGLLYHPYITEQVLAMLEKRRAAADRVKKYRDKQKQQLTEDVTRDLRVSNAQEQEQEQEQDTLTGVRGTSDEVPSRQPRPVDADCPHQEIIDIYHEVLPMMRKVRTWQGQRPKLLRQLWKQHPDPEWFRGYFKFIAKSPFLTGKSTDFVADLEWLIRPQNFQKVHEGKYHQRKRG